MVSDQAPVTARRRLSFRRRRARPRIALVTPWPPERTGIAAYSARLASALAEHADVVVVTAGPAADYPPESTDAIRLIGSGAPDVLAELDACHRVLYCMGNSSFHVHVYELLALCPGVVVLHDVQLTGFYAALTAGTHPDEPGRALAERIEDLYGFMPAADAALDETRMRSLGVHLTREIQGRARECFVHSALAREMLERDRVGTDTPVRVVPFAMPAVSDSHETRAAVSSLIVSPGMVAEIKGVAGLIDAFALIASERPDAQLVIAGPGGEAELARWREYARVNASAAQVEIPGYLEAEPYDALLRDADVAVELRLASNGEASAALADCLAAGLPTIVTDLGWAGELPEGALSRLPANAPAAAIAARLAELLDDTEQRRALSAAAQDVARAHSFARVAEAYLEALELT